MNMLARNRNPRGLNFELSTQPLEEMVKSMFSCFPGFRSDLVFGGQIDTKLDVSVKDKYVEVKFPCPGRCKEDFEIEVVGDFLTVRVVDCGKHKACCDDKRYVIRERVCESYEESVKLPVPVKGAETRAKYEHGVLEIAIPRMSEEKNGTHVVKVS